MIKIKLIQNIIDNKNRKEFQVKFENKSLLEIINDIVLDLKAKEKTNVLKIIINGKKIEDLTIKPKDKDEIIIVYAIAGQEDWIAGITIVGAIVGAILFPAAAAGLYVTAGLTALSWGYSKFAGAAGQRKPNYGSFGNEIDSASPTYGWDGIENTQSAGLPLAIIYGENKVGGNLINLNMTDGTTTPTYTIIFNPAIQGEDYTVSDTGTPSQTADRTVIFTTLNKFLGFSIKIRPYGIIIFGTEGYAQVDVYYKKVSSSTWIKCYTIEPHQDSNDGINNPYTLVNIAGLEEDYYNIKIVFSGAYSVSYPELEGKYTEFKLGTAIYDSIENNQKLNLLLALGEGEIDDIRDVYIDDNPIVNYQDASYQIRKGTVDQSLIDIFQYLNNFFQISAKVSKDTPFSYTTYNNNINGFEINFVFPNGIWSTNDNGAYNSWNITLVIGYKLTSETNYTEQTVTFNYKTRSTYRNTIKKINLTSGKYDIRITKTTNDADNQYTFGDCHVMTINEIIQQSLTYPNTALLALSIKASEQISNNIPTITSVVRGKKILCPVITNPENNNEIVDYDNYYYDDENNCYRSIFDNSALDINENLSAFTKKYCANPIWCLFDLLTDTRYGLGNYISADDIDFDSFLECAKYCDTLSGFSLTKKLRLDIVFDSIASAIDIIQQITQAFRGFVFFTTGKIKVVIDKPETVTQMFSMGNIIAGSFSISKKSNKDYCNSIDITYYDKKNNYKQDVVTVEDQRSISEIGVKNKSIRVFANTAEYAKLAGEYFLRQDKYVNEIISFKAAVDAVMCQPGDVIAVCHDNNSFNKSGRIISYEDGVITVDCDLTIEEYKTYKIQIKLSDDTIIEKDVLNSESGTTREIEVEDNFILDPQSYDIFSFYESTKEIKKYRITNMKKDENLNIEITAIEYNEKVYGDESETDTVKETKYNIDSKGGLQFYNFISAQGNAYIDPDIIASDVGKIEVNGTRISNPQSLSCVFGFFDSLNNATGLWLNGSFITRNWGGYSSISDSNNPYRLSYKFGSHVSNFANKVFIFATKNSSDEMSNFSNNNAKLSSLKFYDAEGVNVIADLQPATYNGVPGMYDNIRKKFFINANSSGKLIIDGIIQEQEEKMVKIVDLSASPQINRSVNLMEVAQGAGGRTDGVSFLARGAVTSGEIKLLGSLDGTNWFNLQDEEGKDVVLHVGVFTELKIRNRFVKCDLTDVTSSNLIVEVQ